MNTADISVLSDDLVVTLNPLRRSSHRARAWCAKVAGMAMPWNSPAADVEPRRRARPGSGPARWPFPPAPAEAGALTGQAVVAPLPMPAPAAPAAAVGVSAAAAPATRERSLGNATVEPVTAQVTMKAMVIDVVMVLAWGAIIPGLMWLGAAAGF